MDSRLKVLMMVVFLLTMSLPRSDAQPLPDEEVNALLVIASKLRYSGWQPTRDSCSVTNMRAHIQFRSNITCSCNTTVCHVTNIQFNRLNLTGVIPEEFANLTSLREIDLTRNYLNGTIPARLGQLRLTILKILGNRISGPIPEEIGDISTLEELVVEDNLLGGQLPVNIGRLTRLRRFLASGNNFTGTIPASYGHLPNLTDFRIDGSNLSGRIPDFIGNWTNIEILYLQGTSMEGPVPSTISLLTKLKELRITDLAGSGHFPFPNLKNVSKTLTLRNCFLTGPIPQYLGNMTSMKILDLSFNGLTGPIPDSFKNLNLDDMFLNDNALSGDLPGWIYKGKEKIDLSYNNFTRAQSRICHSSSLDLVSVLSSSAANNKDAWCLSDQLTCSRSPTHHSLFINCGGPRTQFDGQEYEEDLTSEQAYFYSNQEKWSYSTNGVFLQNDNAPFVGSKADVIGGDIYSTARFSPTSLRYFGLCMRKGSYNVRLHFAEISYSDDMTFSSLGRRYFDISIQGVRYWKNFNIVNEAKGVGKGIYIDFNNVVVNGSTIDIHLYWAGKGTTAIPDRSVYGPLLSAITITPNFNVGLSDGAIVGIVIGSCAFVGLVVAVLWWRGYIGVDKEDKELRALELQTTYFSLRQIKSATDNFDSANKIGEGGFGAVYKGVLPDGSEIAVKQLSARSKQGCREFVTEIAMISALQHPNLVKLYGYCIEGKELLLVYEYLINNNLASALFDGDDQKLNLDWSSRKKICMGIARGLAYLHEGSTSKIVHRDIKATNVLLDKDLNAKISDFGLAKLYDEENTHISTRIAGTRGYMAPEYAMRGHLTDKADVYSFGIVALEIVSGKSNNYNMRNEDDFIYLLDWAFILQRQGNLLELVDPSLGRYSINEVTRMLNIALLCTNPSPTLRPTMSSVVKMLDGEIPVQPPMIKLGAGTPPDMRFKAIDSQTQVSTISEDSLAPRSIPTYNAPWADSSFYMDKSNEFPIPNVRGYRSE